MAAGDMITGPWQIELRDVLMDGDVTCGLAITEWLSGLGVPTMESNDKARAQTHGVFASPEYMRARQLTWQVLIQGATVAAVKSVMNDLGTAMAPVSDTDSDLVVPLVFTLGDAATPYLMYGKPTRLATKYDWMALSYLSPNGMITNPAVCEFTATDPLIYDLAESSGVTGLGSGTGGWNVHNFHFPFGFGTAAPGTVSVDNTGNFDTFPVVTILAGGSGLSGVSITKVETGETWQINKTFLPADVLVVDMGRHTVLVNGGSSAGDVIRPPSVWMSAPAGTTTWQFGGTGAGSTMTVAWHNAHLF